jgi:vacuolar-type H+-ATPase subunit H
MLEKLLGVEKTAAGLIAEAEAEAGRRTTQARLDAQKRHVELLKAKAAENETSLEAERTRIEAERAARNQVEKEKLTRLPVDQARFRTAILSLIEKGGE